MRTLSQKLLLAFALLFVMNGVVVLRLYQTGQNHASGWLRFFNFDSESNLPTWFSVFLLGTAAWKLWQLSKLDSVRQTFWRILGGVFAFLALDELAQIHEKFNSIGRDLVGYREGIDGGWLHHAWTLPYLLIFVVLGVFLLPTLLRLPRPLLLRFVLAGTLFLLGAVGVEMFTGTILTSTGKNTGYYLSTTLEESLEMLGVIYFIFLLGKAPGYLGRAEE